MTSGFAPGLDRIDKTRSILMFSYRKNPAGTSRKSIRFQNHQFRSQLQCSTTPEGLGDFLEFLMNTFSVISSGALLDLHRFFLIIWVTCLMKCGWHTWFPETLTCTFRWR